MATAQDTLVDPRSLEAASDYSGHLMCAVCHCPFVRPVRLRCDHIFCQACLNNCITASPTYVHFKPPPDSFLCPTCRTTTNASFHTVPRLVLSMCDEILVKCPYVKEGCEEVIQRGHVQAHVDKYCDYRLVPCPSLDCDKKTRKRDLDAEGECVHALRECENCGDAVMRLDYETHRDEGCPKTMTTCPDCESSIPVTELVKHLEDCPKATRTCQASAYGCNVKMRNAEIEEHEKSCPLVTLGPYLDTQSSRIASMESTVRQFQQRNQELEDGIASIRSTLSQAASRPISSTTIAPPALPPADPAEEADTGSSTPSELDAAANTPSSSTTNYLLSIHESLREEVERLSTSLNTVDARASMSIMNENLRVREDMAHINAALNTVRMQVHMLMNQRMNQSPRPDNPRGASTPGTGAGSIDALGPGSSRVSGPIPEHFRGRRLSDSGREATKL